MPILEKVFKQAFVDRLHIVLENFVPGVVERESAVAMQVFERLDGQIRIHGAGAVAQQQREVHHFARLARFDDQRHLIAGLLADQMIVNGGKRQQAGYGRMLVVHAAVGKNQQRVARLYGQRGRTAEVLDGFFELLFAALHAEEHGQGGGQKIAPAYAAQFLEAPVGDDGMAQLERVAILGRLVEDISFRADIGIQRHHQAFADRDRWPDW